jgi:hypothetical protein
MNVKDSFARPDDTTAPCRPADEGSSPISLRRALSEWQSQATVMTSLGFDRGLECNCVGYFCALLKEKACSCSLRCMRLSAFVSNINLQYKLFPAVNCCLQYGITTVYGLTALQLPTAHRVAIDPALLPSRSCSLTQTPKHTTEDTTN